MEGLEQQIKEGRKGDEQRTLGGIGRVPVQPEDAPLSAKFERRSMLYANLDANARLAEDRKKMADEDRAQENTLIRRTSEMQFLNPRGTLT